MPFFLHIFTYLLPTFSSTLFAARFEDFPVYKAASPTNWEKQAKKILG
jgi:hypothetical protein